MVCVAGAGVVTLKTKNCGLSDALAGATTCGPDQWTTLRGPTSRISQDHPGTSAPGWLVLLVDALLTCNLAGPHDGLVQPASTIAFTSTVVSPDPLKSAVCSNGTRTEMVVNALGAYGGVVPSAPVPPAGLGANPNVAAAGTLA